MKFYFQNKTNYKIKPEIFERIAHLVFNKLRLSDKIEIGLKLTDNLEIKKLNSTYRGINEPTDVLSFPIDTLLTKPNSEYLMLGDVVISVEMAKKYSQGDKKGIRKELTQLFRHGLLHLLGYDHEKNPDEWQKIKNKIKK